MSEPLRHGSWPCPARTLGVRHQLEAIATSVLRDLPRRLADVNLPGPVASNILGDSPLRHLNSPVCLRSDTRQS